MQDVAETTGDDDERSHIMQSSNLPMSNLCLSKQICQAALHDVVGHLRRLVPPPPPLPSFIFLIEPCCSVGYQPQLKTKIHSDKIQVFNVKETVICQCEWINLSPADALFKCE